MPSEQVDPQRFAPDKDQILQGMFFCRVYSNITIENPADFYRKYIFQTLAMFVYPRV